jgi:hypothetical protein
MSIGILRVKGDKVVGDDGKPVVLRGAAIGGWMKYILKLLLVPSR